MGQPDGFRDPGARPRAAGWWRLSRRSTVVVLVAAVGLAGSTGVAVASISARRTGGEPGRGGTVLHGCYARTTGALRLINPSARQHCRRGERAVSWNQAGRAGARDPAGAQGPLGPRGDTIIAYCHLLSQGAQPSYFDHGSITAVLVNSSSGS